MLALWAEIRDASSVEMQRGLDSLFPESAQARRNEPSQQFASFQFFVVIDAEAAHRTWYGYGPGRAGLELPIPNPEETFSGAPHTWPRWDIAMKNMLRIDLQRQIEANGW